MIFQSNEGKYLFYCEELKRKIIRVRIGGMKANFHLNVLYSNAKIKKVSLPKTMIGNSTVVAWLWLIKVNEHVTSNEVCLITIFLSTTKLKKLSYSSIRVPFSFQLMLFEDKYLFLIDKLYFILIIYYHRSFLIEMF